MANPSATRVLKILTWSLLGLVGLVLAVAVFLLVWIDPNNYRDNITHLVKDKTGLVLKIDGKIGWTLYPAIGFSVEKVSLATAEGAAPLASVGKAAVSVQLLPLFSKQVRVDTLYIDKAMADLVVGTDGKGNWEALAKAGGADGQAPTPETAPKKPADAGGTPLLVSVPEIVITNSVFEYNDQRSSAQVIATVKELVVKDIALNKEFPLHLLGKVSTNTKIDVDVDLQAQVSIDTDKQRYAVRALDLKSNVAGILAKPFGLDVATDASADMGAKKIAVTRLEIAATGLVIGNSVPMGAHVSGPLALDLGADTASVGPLALSADSVDGALTVAVKDLTKQLSYSGTLEVKTFNPKNLMRDFSIAAPATSDPLAMTKVALKTAFEGTTANAMLKNIDITLDDTHLRGSAGVTDVATSALAFDLNVDAINVDRYLPPPAPAAAKTAAPAAAPAGGKPAPLLPVALLRKLNVDGKLAIGKVTVTELPATNLAATLKAKGGDIHLDPLAASVLDGTVRGDVQIDARGDDPRIVSHLKLDRIEVGGLVKRFAGKDLFTGKTSLNLNVDTTGNDTGTLMKKAVGALDMNFADATLKGMNLTNMLNDALTQQLGPFAALVPDYQKKLPKSLQNDTAFSTLAANATIKDGIVQVPALTAASKDGAIKGGGQFNLVTTDFDYTLGMRSASLADNKYFANSEFPVRCKGNVSGSPADWCRPDGKAIGDILKQAATGVAKDRIKSELTKQLGIGNASVDGAKQDVKQQVEQKKDEVKQKAQDEVKKNVQDALKKFF